MLATVTDAHMPGHLVQFASDELAIDHIGFG
jgi:hypothetical protein